MPCHVSQMSDIFDGQRAMGNTKCCVDQNYRQRRVQAPSCENQVMDAMSAGHPLSSLMRDNAHRPFLTKKSPGKSCRPALIYCHTQKWGFTIQIIKEFLKTSVQIKEKLWHADEKKMWRVRGRVCVCVCGRMHACVQACMIITLKVKKMWLFVRDRGQIRELQNIAARDACHRTGSATCTVRYTRVALVFSRSNMQ